MDTRPIGIFDSGLGGLNVLKEIRKKLPKEDIIYLGDTKNFPYGSKTKENIIELSKNNIEFLIRKNVKLIVIACGTATSQALEEVKDKYPIPIVGIIEPTVEKMKESGNKQKIAVIATAGTIRSKAWEIELKRKIPQVEVISSSCPLLAQMAEEGWTENEIAKLTIKEYMKPFKNKKIDKIILGCTHYTLFTKLIKEELGEEIEIVDTGEKMAEYLEKLLKKYNLQNEQSNKKQEIYLTEKQEKFKEIAEKLLGESIQISDVEMY